MKEKTIDYVLRATWISISKMYNEEASKEGSTMATGFALLSIDPENGTPSTSLGPKMGMEATSLSRTLKTMEDKGLITRKKNPRRWPKCAYLSYRFWEGDERLFKKGGANI